MWGEEAATMSDKCTWKDCTADAEFPQVAQDGETWANLCAEHNQKLEASYGDPPKMLSAWVLAGGGAAKMTKRMLGDK